MHSAFLYHGIKNGMNMGIVNPEMLEVYDQIPKDLLLHIEDVLLNRRDDATQRLLEFAEDLSDEKKTNKHKEKSWRSLDLQGRITHSLVKGIDEFIHRDVEDARQIVDMKELGVRVILDCTHSTQRPNSGNTTAGQPKYALPIAKIGHALGVDGYFFEVHPKPNEAWSCLLYTSPSPRDQRGSRMPAWA